MQDDDLTGEWTGVYDYPDSLGEAVPFKVFITDANGQISGEMNEPNTFVETAGSVLSSVITGCRNGSSITFLKIYESHEYTDGYEISYEGNINGDMSVINGVWTTIEEFPFSGPFVMNRAQKSKQKIEEGIAEEILLR